jgi:endonuclease-3 related protein
VVNAQQYNLTSVVISRYLSIAERRAAMMSTSKPSSKTAPRPVRLANGSTHAPTSAVLQSYFNSLSTALGPMNWWPAKTPFEVIVGAILTQSTAWANVEQALTNLRNARLLSPARMERVPERRLAHLIRPSGYFRQKAKKLKAFSGFLRKHYAGSLVKMFGTPTVVLRGELLAVHGIGPETADSILLYAGGHPVFVVDAYTHRILRRHGLSSGTEDYSSVQSYFENNLPRDPALYNEFHALIVNTGKNWCRKSRPRCEDCPLWPYLPETGSLQEAMR